MPSKKKQHKKRPAAAPTTTAWSRLDTSRQNKITATVDKLLETRDDNDDGDYWKEIAISELQLGMILNDTILPKTHSEISHLLARLEWQTQQARKVFALLDTNTKGCVVAQDLLQADLDGELEEDHVLEMIQEFAADGDILTMDDIIHIARLVNLS